MYNFQTFGYSNESLPNSSCHFWNHKIRVYSNFASLFSGMKDNSCAFFFSAQTLHTLDKIAHWSEMFELLSGWVKIHHILHVIFETTSQFFFKLCITLQCHGRKVFCTFLAETLFEKESTTVQNFRLSTAQVKFHQNCLKYIKFQLKKVWTSYVLWYQSIVQNLKRAYFLFQKW